MLGEILSGLKSIFKSGTMFLKDRRQQRDAALDSIYVACTETKTYVVDWERTNRRDRAKERALATLWKKTSILVRPYDAPLADKCYYKGEYWLDPDNWNQEDSQRLQIDLDRVILEAKDLKVMEDEEYKRNKLRRNRR